VLARVGAGEEAGIRHLLPQRRSIAALKARQVIAEARDRLGGNGILLDYHVMRHMADIEAIYTYEGTEHIQTLIVGRDITGVSAFS
jgi:glutaryl-CoA dehydrogenase